MQKDYVKFLLRTIGGIVRENENQKARLARIARAAGIHPRMIDAAFYNGYVSKKDKPKLEAAARKEARENDSEIILRMHALIRYLETVDPEMHRQDINAARQFLAQYEDHSGRRVFANVRYGILDDC